MTPDEQQHKDEDAHPPDDGSERAQRPDPIELEPHDDDRPRGHVWREPDSPSDDDGDKPVHIPLEEQFTCPNCNAVMPDDALVCLRCGFDMKALEQKRTRIGKPEEIDEEEPDEDDDVEGSDKPLSRPGRGDLWVPAVVGGLSALLLIVGYFAGAPGLFPHIRAAAEDQQLVEIATGERFLSVLRFVILLAFMSACAMGGMFMLAMALRRPFGDYALAAVRFASVIAAMRLISFINFGSAVQTERLVEGVLQAGVFVGLSTLAFSLKPRTGLMLGGFSLIAWIGIVIAARLVEWAVW